MHNKITIIGCGVSGLSCGIRFLEQGVSDVTIIARDIPPNTTSNRAAAIWFPYRAYPEDKVLGWSVATFDAMLPLYAEPAAGVSNATLIKLYREPVPDPWWKDGVPSCRRATAEDMPAGYVDGFVVEVPLIETNKYMDYLVVWYTQLGGKIEQREISAFSDIDEDLVVNCAGLGSKELTNDDRLFPIRGQIIRATAVSNKTTFIDEFDGGAELAYIIPRSDDTIIGGTAQEHNWDLEANLDTAESILQNGRKIHPDLDGVEVIEHLVGLRPGRDQVRLEREQLPSGQTIIHNYGHGGAGFTLSWGCADEVLALAVK